MFSTRAAAMNPTSSGFESPDTSTAPGRRSVSSAVARAYQAIASMGATRDQKGIAAVECANDADRSSEGLARQQELETPEPREPYKCFQSRAHRAALRGSDPRGDTCDLPPCIGVPGDGYHTRMLIARGRDAQQGGQAVARHQQCGCPGPGDALVQPVCNSHGPPSVHQIREQYLTSRIGVGADDDPNDPKE
jgi:hypothetical protein